MSGRRPRTWREAGEPFDFGKARENFTDGSKRRWKVQVIAVEPAHDFAGRVGEAFVERIVKSAVRFAARPSQAVGVACDDFPAAVGGTTVDNDVVKAGII